MAGNDLLMFAKGLTLLLLIIWTLAFIGIAAGLLIGYALRRISDEVGRLFHDS